MQIQKLCHKPPVNMHIKFVIALKNWKRQLLKHNRLSTIFINFFPKRNRLHFNSVVRCTGVCNFFSLKCKEDCLFLELLEQLVLYGLVVWNGCPNADLLHSRSTSAYCKEVYRHSNWNTLTFYCKLRLIKLLHISVFIGEAPAALSYSTNKPCTAYNFRRSNNIIVPRFNPQFLKNYVIAIDALFFGTLSRLILQTTLLFFFSQSEEGLLF